MGPLHKGPDAPKPRRSLLWASLTLQVLAFAAGVSCYLLLLK